MFALNLIEILKVTSYNIKHIQNTKLHFQTTLSFFSKYMFSKKYTFEQIVLFACYCNIHMLWATQPNLVACIF